MFDLFLLYDFDKRGREKALSRDFSSLAAYEDVRYRTRRLDFPSGGAVYLERNETDNSCARKDGCFFFVYGTVFANHRYQRLRSTPPHKLEPDEIADLFREFRAKSVDFIKGSFALVVVEETQAKVSVITDRLNVLPLYYCFKDGLLVLSSSVRLIRDTGVPSSALDPQALAEQLLFDYMLRDHYFYKEIRQTENARIYSFGCEGVRSESYWSVGELYHDELLPRKNSLDLLSDQLYENVGLYVSDREATLVSFTGGFDGRTNVAMIRRPRDAYLCYSYGMPGSRQVAIPQAICRSLGIAYRPVLLDGRFEKEYGANAMKAIEFSNGTAPIIRANYPYAYRELRGYSDLILTGLFGSEILRPLHNLGIMINDRSEQIFLNDDFRPAIRRALFQRMGKNYLEPELIRGACDSIIEEFRADYFDRFAQTDRVTRFFFFIIQEGIRKYFMQEVQIERVYVTTRFPYLDDDFVDLVYRTTFAGMYNGFLGKSKVKRRKGQLLYAHIIRKFMPEMGRYKLDRGYAPDDLLRPFPFNYLRLAMGVWRARRVGDDAFDTERWARDTIREAAAGKPCPGVFGAGLEGSFRDGSYLSDFLTYTHMVSLKEYIEK